jgi:hypothetical protein
LGGSYDASQNGAFSDAHGLHSFPLVISFQSFGVKEKFQEYDGRDAWKGPISHLRGP